MLKAKRSVRGTGAVSIDDLPFIIAGKEMGDTEVIKSLICNSV